jgi:hypothetical protein
MTSVAMRVPEEIVTFYRRLAATLTAESGNRVTITDLINEDLHQAMERRSSPDADMPTQ